MKEFNFARLWMYAEGVKPPKAPSPFFFKIMKYWQTTMKAIDPRDGKLKKWIGFSIPGIDIEDAREYCKKMGLFYLTVQEIEDAESEIRFDNHSINDLYFFQAN